MWWFYLSLLLFVISFFGIHFLYVPWYPFLLDLLIVWRCVLYLWGWKSVDFLLAILRVGCIHGAQFNISRRIYYIKLWSHALLPGLVAILSNPLWVSLVLCRCPIFPLHMGSACIDASFFSSFVLYNVCSFSGIPCLMFGIYYRAAYSLFGCVAIGPFLLGQAVPLLRLPRSTLRWHLSCIFLLS